MAGLKAAVHVSKPVPTKDPPGVLWSPISCTLIFSEKEAVLVDVPTTIRATRELINWIEEGFPSVKISYVYITHGHGDHWFGLPLILERWPDAVPVATQGTIEHMKENASPPWFETIWAPRFPNQICQPFVYAQPLPQDGQFKLEGKYAMQAIECGVTDTHNTTVLWVPDLRLVAGGDVVYGSCYQMLAFTNTPALRAEWIKALDKVAALDPLYVVPGHKRDGEIDGVWHIENTKKYIEDFGRLFDAGPSSAEEVYQKMMELYPDRFNNSALKSSCAGTFNALKG